MLKTSGASSETRRRLFSLLSLVLFSILVLGYFWWGRFRYQHALMIALTYGGCALLALANHLRHGDDLKRLGLRADNFGRAARWWGPTTAGLCAAIALAGLIFGELDWGTWDNVTAYVLWAPVQQHALQNFLRLRSREVVSPGKPADASAGAIVLTASLFALYHLPDPVLAGAAFLGAALWCWLFERAPNLFWASFSNAVVTIVLMVFFKYSVFNQFEVGLTGYRYDFYGGGVKVAGGFDAQGQPFVVTLPGPDADVPSLVRTFDPTGRKLSEWTAFEDLAFSGEIAVGDLGFGPGDEIVTVPGPGIENPSLVRIFDAAGSRLGEFSVQPWTGGYGLSVWVSCGTIYLSPGPAPWAPQQVYQYASDGRLLRRWDFSDLELVNGVRSAAICETRVKPQEEDFPALLLLWGTDVSVNPSTIHIFDPRSDRSRSISTIGTTFGVQASLVKIDGQPAVATAPGPLRGYPPLIHVYDLEGRKLHDFASSLILPEGCGANLGSLDVDGDGRDELLVGEGVCADQPAIVSVRTLDGALLSQWNAYPEGF